jgi:hypothetical protein
MGHGAKKDMSMLFSVFGFPGEVNYLNLNT